MPRSTIARIDTNAIRQNYRRALALGNGTRAMAVIKADGYGHGIRDVAVALKDEAPKFAVACIEEAHAIREAGVSQPVVLLQGPHSDQDIGTSEAEGFELVIHSEHQLNWLDQQAVVPVLWIKVNSGMNRLGFSPADLEGVMARLEAAGHGQKITGFVTHFACADDPSSDFTAQQTDCFARAVAPWPHLEKSLGNSAAHFREGQSLYDWSRPGIMLYGASPMINTFGPDLDLEPAMTLEAELTSVRTIQAGEAVGYGGSFKATQETRMGIVAVGYGDGYPRHAGTDTPAWVNGRRIRLIGRVSMDMLAVDLNNAPNAKPGDRVELWGKNISVDEVARHAGTIGYELLTGVTVRVPRVRE
ncbi:alanine racemase [Marinobacter sp. CHS3-4]|uniref:alanine racemase n=1 Tax=Marinobacter sp. CHS3-4 TaxID=3045174 RepID=UPI0024B502CE|nr:alanine racemase [Marinobacter sp. CHS3-4]MDI9246202.1 alanine racemase [Marinobacter sp. CHS3-4]